MQQLQDLASKKGLLRHLSSASFLLPSVGWAILAHLARGGVEEAAPVGKPLPDPDPSTSLPPPTSGSKCVALAARSWACGANDHGESSPVALVPPPHPLAVLVFEPISPSRCRKAGSRTSPLEASCSSLMGNGNTAFQPCQASACVMILKVPLRLAPENQGKSLRNQV